MYALNPDPRAAEALVGMAAAEVEQNLILATLRQTGGNRTHAAHILGISIRTMRNKLRAYAEAGIVIDESPDATG